MNWRQLCCHIDHDDEEEEYSINQPFQKRAVAQRASDSTTMNIQMFIHTLWARFTREEMYLRGTSHLYPIRSYNG